MDRGTILHPRSTRIHHPQRSRPLPRGTKHPILTLRRPGIQGPTAPTRAYGSLPLRRRPTWPGSGKGEARPLRATSHPIVQPREDTQADAPQGTHRTNHNAHVLGAPAGLTLPGAIFGRSYASSGNKVDAPPTATCAMSCAHADGARQPPRPGTAPATPPHHEGAVASEHGAEAALPGAGTVSGVLVPGESAWARATGHLCPGATGPVTSRNGCITPSHRRATTAGGRRRPTAQPPSAKR